MIGQVSPRELIALLRPEFHVPDTGAGAPAYNAEEGRLYWDITNDNLYANMDGTNNWQLIGGGGGIGGGGAANQVTYWTGALTIAGDAGFTYNAATDTITLAGGITLTGGAASVITVNDNVANALTIVDAGATEYMRIITTDAQPIVRFNDGGADVDFYVEAVGVADAFVIQGSDGQCTIGALATGYVYATAGVLSVVDPIPLTDLGSYGAGRLIYGGAVDWTTLGHPAAQDRVLQSTAAGITWSANAVTFPAAGAVPVGTGANTQVSFWTGANTISGDAGMTYNSGTNTLTVGAIDVSSGGDIDPADATGMDLGNSTHLWDLYTREVYFNAATGANIIQVPDNVADALHILDAGALEYLQITSTDAQPIVTWNDGGADVDFYVETVGVADALFIRGSDGRCTLGGAGTGVRATLANAEGLYVPWIAGDADATAYFGSTNASNDQNAIEAFTDSGYGVLAYSADLVGVQGSSATGIGVEGVATGAGTGVYGKSATGNALIANLTGAGTSIANFYDNGVPVLTIQDGGQADFAEYIRHLGDTDTYLRFQNNQVTLVSGATETLDGGGVAGTWAFSGISGVTVEDGDYIGAGAGCSWLYDSSNGDITTTADVGAGTVAPDSRIHAYEAAGVCTVHIEAAGANQAARVLLENDAQAWDVRVQINDRFIVSDFTGGTNPFVIEAGAPTSTIYADSNGRVGIGDSSPDAPLDVSESDAVTAAITDIAILEHLTSGTAAANFGAGLLYQLEDAGGTSRDAMRQAVVWQSAAAAENAEFQLYLNYNGTLYDCGVVVGPGAAIVAGNQRGIGAVDWQGYRTVAAEVASGDYATIIGGQLNTASGDYSTALGGTNNDAAGDYSVALGLNSSATHNQSFVWSATGVFGSWGADTFTAAAVGGARFYTAAGTTTGVEVVSATGDFVPLAAKTHDLGSSALEWDNIYYVTANTGTSRLLESSRDCPVCGERMKRGTGTVCIMGEDADYAMAFCINCGNVAVEEWNHHKAGYKARRQAPPEIIVENVRVKGTGRHIEVAVDFRYGNVTNSTRLSDSELDVFLNGDDEGKDQLLYELGMREWESREESRIIRQDASELESRLRTSVDKFIGADIAR